MIQWTQIQDGAELGVLFGDPDLPGASFTIRFRTSREIRVAPHWHPEDECVTVLDGPFALGFGEVFDAVRLTQLESGAFFCITRSTRHFALYSAGTVIQVSGFGPFKSIYVDPAGNYFG